MNCATPKALSLTRPDMRRIIPAITAAMLCSAAAQAQETVRLGIIGLDTSHSIEFTKLLNDTSSTDAYVQKFEVTAAYPYGSRTIETASSRIARYSEQIKGYGVTVTSSIEELLDMVDCVLLETNDGHLHLDQALKVFRAGKGCYIDKPLGATLGETIAIYEAAEKYGIPIFSSSALRFSTENVKIRAGEYGRVLSADCYSPHSPEPSHPDFGYYGIHGVEILYAAMGPGCESVTRMHSDDGDVVVGRWSDGRIGTFRAITKGPYLYGGTVITDRNISVQAGGYEGYRCLLDRILKFLETGIPPVGKDEIIEMFAFMKASNMSLGRGGQYVTIGEAMEAGREDAGKLLQPYGL